MTSTSLTLLQRVRRREDRDAWERFVVLYTPLLLRWVQRSGLSEEDAVDLVQDVFATLLVELPRFEYDAHRGPFRAWLKTVTLNQCRDRHRKRLIAQGRGGDDEHLAAVPGSDLLGSLPGTPNITSMYSAAPWKSCRHSSSRGPGRPHGR